MDAITRHEREAAEFYRRMRWTRLGSGSRSALLSEARIGGRLAVLLAESRDFDYNTRTIQRRQLVALSRARARQTPPPAAVDLPPARANRAKYERRRANAQHANSFWTSLNDPTVRAAVLAEAVDGRERRIAARTARAAARAAALRQIREFDALLLSPEAMAQIEADRRSRAALADRRRREWALRTTIAPVGMTLERALEIAIAALAARE